MVYDTSTMRVRLRHQTLSRTLHRPGRVGQGSQGAPRGPRIALSGVIAWLKILSLVGDICQHRDRSTDKVEMALVNWRRRTRTRSTVVWSGMWCQRTGGSHNAFQSSKLALHFVGGDTFSMISTGHRTPALLFGGHALLIGLSPEYNGSSDREASPIRTTALQALSVYFLFVASTISRFQEPRDRRLSAHRQRAKGDEEAPSIVPRA